MIKMEIAISKYKNLKRNMTLELMARKLLVWVLRNILISPNIKTVIENQRI